MAWRMSCEEGWGQPEGKEGRRRQGLILMGLP
jgi:hypothetical protein